MFNRFLEIFGIKLKLLPFQEEIIGQIFLRDEDLKGDVDMAKDRNVIKTEVNAIIDNSYHFKADRVKKLTEYAMRESAEMGLTEYLKTNPVPNLTNEQRTLWVNAVVEKMGKILGSKKVFTKCKPVFEEEDDDYNSEFDDLD